MNERRIKQTSLILNNYILRLTSRTRKFVKRYLLEFPEDQVSGPVPFGYTVPDLEFQINLEELRNVLIDLDRLSEEISWQERKQCLLDLQIFQANLPEELELHSSGLLTSKGVPIVR